MMDRSSNLEGFMEQDAELVQDARNRTRAKAQSPVPDLTGGPLAGPGRDTSNGSQGPWDVFDTLPRIGLYRTEDHQYFHNGNGPYPSVTTVLKVVNKWGLNNYRERATARYAFQWPQLMDGVDLEEAISRTQALVDEDRDVAGRLGTSVHHLADLMGADESALRGFPIPDEQIPYAMGFQSFLGHLVGSGGEIASSEKAVLSVANHYAGTYDLILRWQCKEHGSCLWLVDIKTYKSGPFAEDAWQLAGYINADYVIVEGNPDRWALPHIDHAAILHVRPDKYAEGWALYEYVGLSQGDYLAFLACLEIWQWQQLKRFSRKELNTHKATATGPGAPAQR